MGSEMCIRDSLSGLAEQTDPGPMPTGLTGLAGAAGADLDRHGVEVAAIRRALNPKGIAVELPTHGFKVEGGAVDGIQPAMGSSALGAGVPKGQGDGLPVDGLATEAFAITLPSGAGAPRRTSRRLPWLLRRGES